VLKENVRENFARVSKINQLLVVERRIEPVEM